MRDLAVGYLAIAALTALLAYTLSWTALLDAKNLRRPLPLRRQDAKLARDRAYLARFAPVWPLLVVLFVAGWVADARATLKEL